MTAEEDQTPAPSASAPTEQSPPSETPVPSGPTSAVPMDERLLGAAAYIPMLFVGAIIMKPKSKFCQLHGKQGLFVTLITFFVLLMLVAIPLLGSLLFLALIALIGIGAFQAYSGNEFKIPVIYQIAEKINVDTLFTGTTVKPVSTKPGKPTETPATPAAPTPPPTETPTETPPPQSPNPTQQS